MEYTGKEANSSAIDDIIKYLQNSKPAENNGIQDLINVSSLKSQHDFFLVIIRGCDLHFMNLTRNIYFQSYLKDTTGAADGNPDPQFIRKLTTAVAESTIKGNK